MSSCSVYYKQCLQLICIISCLSGMSIWPVVKGDESSCACEEGDEICKCLERYVTRSEFSNFKHDLNIKHEALMYQLVSRIEMLEEAIEEYRRNMPLLTTEIKKREEIVSNISKRVEKLQEENKLLKEQLSEEKRYRRSLEDDIQFLDERVNHTDSWLNNMNVTGTDMLVLEKTVRLLGEEKLQQLAHIVGSYTVEVVELKVVNSKDKSKPEKSKVFISVIETQNDTSDGNDNVVSPETEMTGEEISRYVKNMTTMFTSKIQDLEERLEEFVNSHSSVQLQFSSLEKNFKNHKREMSDVLSNLNSSVITYEILEQLIKDVTGDILRSDTAFIGISASDTIGVSSETLEKIFMNMLEKGTTIDLPNIGVDYGFYFKTYTSHPRLISLLEGIKLLLGTAVINVRADMEAILIEHSRTTEYTHANRTVEIHQRIDSITNNVEKLLANHSIFEEKYQEKVEEVTQKMNLFNNQTLEKLIKVEDTFSEATGNISNLVETNMIHTTEQLDMMWMELNTSNKRFDQLEEKTINATQRLDNMDAVTEDLRNTTYYLSEETKSLQTSIDDAMSMVNDLQRNSSFYASVLDIERIENATKEVGNAINVVQEDYLPELQERIYTNIVKELMANHSIFEEKYQEKVEEVTQKMNLFNNHTLEKLIKVEDTFSEAMGNISNLVETNMIHTTEQLEMMWMELNTSFNKRFDQLEEKTINATKRLNNMVAATEDLRNTTHYLSEETKSLKTSIDDAMSMVNDLQRNSSFYASALDIERLENVTKELGSAINVVQEDYLPELQERIYTNIVKELMANHSIFEEKYQEKVEEVMQKMNLFNNQTLEKFIKVEDTFSEGMGNVSNLVETNMIHTTEQLDMMWIELNTSNKRFDQLEEKTINATKRLNNMDAATQDLHNTTYYLSEQTKSLQTSIDDAMSMVNDLQRNSSFYASVLDIERMENVTKELDSAINVVQEDYLPELQERIYKVEMDIFDIMSWKKFLSGINTTEPTSTEDTRTKLPTETPKYCSPITIEHPNLNVSDGESFFKFTSENERRLAFLPAGSIIYFVCQPVGKYEIVGRNVLSCDENGQWDGEVPSCQKLKDQRVLKAFLKGEKCPEPSGTFPHPKSCSKFYNCYNGVAHEQDCGPGLYFDPDKFCTYPHDTECDSGKRPVKKEPPAIIFDPPIESLSVNAKGQVVVVSGKEVGMYCVFPRKWGNPTWITKAMSSDRQVADFWKSEPEGKDYDNEYGLIIRDSDSTNTGNYTCMTPMGGQHTIEIIVQGPPPSKVDGCVPLPIQTREGLVVKPDKAFYKEGHMVMFKCEKGYKFKMPFVSKATCIKGGKWTVSSSKLPSCIKL